MLETTSQLSLSTQETTDECVDISSGSVKFLHSVLSKKCKKCNSVKPPQSHHCSICGRCIARMDHHCPWVNNCVGFYNQKFFLLFLVYVALGSSHALVMIAWQGMMCLEQNCVLFTLHPGNIVLAAISSFLAVLFCMFVTIMFCDQMSCILGNTSTVDKLKKERNLGIEEKGQKATSRTGWQNLEEVFGSSFNIYWLFPTEVVKDLIVEREFD